MKPFKLLFVFLMLAITASAQFGMPSFNEVVNHFFTRYSYDEQEGYLRFQRKKQGWYVSVEKYDSMGHYSNTAFLWSKEGNSFLDIDYPPNNSDSTGLHDVVERFFKKNAWDFNEYGFGRALYYGYAGWDWDVINEPINEAAASDTLLESMARAYSSYASGFVTDQFDFLFTNNDSDRVLLKATDSISNSRLDKLISYDLKSIEYYAKLEALNPTYITKVGSPALKKANEYMFLYYWLTLGGDSIRAKQYAGKAVYTDSMLAVSKNYLRSLPKNSILITGGDNDTYPVWYVQAIEHFRTDVTVINYSLLALRRQLVWLDKQHYHRLFTTKDTSYLNKKFDYSVYSNKGKGGQALELGTFLKELRNKHNPFLDETLNYDSVSTYYTKNVFLARAGGKHSKKLVLNDYLLLNDYMLLDIVQSHKPGSVYTAFNIELLAPILQYDGVVFKIIE